ncbi:Wadjet anti-phage system protein JetD domain-containing protein [Trinickia sp. EG282A]|uniref:Wadjet anti-phage system protein JetD domain-containing protein n=1 Tax=Trinickia sp. EG282A TaxID=3237013 RepID=UPI0034D33B2A
MPLKELGGALLPDDLAVACRRQQERCQIEWLARPSESSWPLSVALRGPSDRQAADAPGAVRAWLSAWNDFDRASRDAGRRASVVWRSLKWRTMGNVTVPERVLFDDAQSVADCAGMHRHWDTLNFRWQRLIEQHPIAAGQRDCASAVVKAAQWSDADFWRLMELLAWCEHNQGSGLYLRQLPLVDIDTKWIEGRRGVVEPLVRILLAKEGDIHQVMGLKRAPATVRMRLLDAGLRAQMLGMEDLQMPVGQWNHAFVHPPKRLLIVENLASGLALPDIDGAAVAMALGNNVTVLHDIGWVHTADVLYWGDVDTWGLHILSRARGVFPHLKSVLMTEAVVESHRHLLTDEPTQDARPAEHLTKDEAQLLSDLQTGRWGERRRLEQERIYWPSVCDDIHRQWPKRAIALS